MENAIHFCKNVQENIYCIKEYSNKRSNSQKFKTANLIEKIYYLFNDTKIIILKYLPHFIKDHFELEGEIFNIFKDAKYNSYLSSRPLNNTTTNFNTTFNVISIHNFWIQDYPEYKNDKKSRAIEWLNDILGLFYKYLLYLQKIFELLIYAKNGLWHPEFFDPSTFISYQQSLKQDFINFELSETIRYSKMQYLIYQYQLILTLSTPNMGRNEFQIYKIHPSPINHNLPINPKPTIFLKPETQYVGISDDKKNYFILDDNYLNSCSNIFESDID